MVNTPGFGLMSPLPCVSPIPTANNTTHGTHPRNHNHGNNGAGNSTAVTSSSSVANAGGRGGFDDELSALLGRIEVLQEDCYGFYPYYSNLLCVLFTTTCIPL